MDEVGSYIDFHHLPLSLRLSKATAQSPQGVTGQTQAARIELETYCWYARTIPIQLSASVCIQVQYNILKSSFQTLDI